MREKKAKSCCSLGIATFCRENSIFSILTQVDGKVQSLFYLRVTLSIFDPGDSITVTYCFFSAFS